jgi:general nucleoside transport system permease protein
VTSLSAAPGPQRHRLAAALTGPTSVSVLAALVIGGLIIAASGGSPTDAYTALAKGAFTGTGPRDTLERTIPLAGMAFVFAIPYRAGIVNLGGEGQMIVGGLSAAVVAINAAGPAWLVIGLAMFAGMAGGGIWAAIPAAGQRFLAVPILITSLLLNYIARSGTSYVVRTYVGDPNASASQTRSIPVENRIPSLPVLGDVSVAVLLLVVLIAAVWLYNRRTVSGYETLMTGFNPTFARYGGVGVERQRARLMIVAGAIGGAVGAELIVGELFVYQDGDLVGTAFAWSGLMIALLAPRNPIGIALAAAAFAALQVGGLSMQRTTDVSWQLAQVLQAVVIIAFIGRFAIRWRPRRPGSGGDMPAAGLSGVLKGEPDV